MVEGWLSAGEQLDAVEVIEVRVWERGEGEGWLSEGEQHYTVEQLPAAKGGRTASA